LRVCSSLQMILLSK